MDFLSVLHEPACARIECEIIELVCHARSLPSEGTAARSGGGILAGDRRRAFGVPNAGRRTSIAKARHGEILHLPVMTYCSQVP